MKNPFGQKIRAVLKKWDRYIPSLGEDVSSAKGTLETMEGNTPDPTRSTVAFTIPNGNQESDVIDTGGIGQIVSLDFPAALDGTQFELLGSYDNNTFKPVMDQYGTDYVIPFVADRKVSIEPATLLPYRYVKLKSDSAETTERSFEALIKYLG